METLLIPMICHATNILLGSRQQSVFTSKWVCGSWSFISHGFSRVQLVRDESGPGIYGGCSELIASNYTRVACTVALHILSQALEHVSGLSIALESSTLHGMSYLDVRIWFSLHDVICNFHLLALPLFDRDTGENMFDVLVQFLNAFHPQWRDILVGSSSDGARAMTGSLPGISTRLGKCFSAKLIRIWSGLHLLVLVMQRVSRIRLNKNSIQLYLP
jgi:hypothetical protein